MLVASIVALLAAALTPRAAAAIERDAFDASEMVGVRASDPESAKLLESAEGAAQSGRLEEALAMLRRVEAKMPDETLARRRACEVLTALGRANEARNECYRGLEMSHSNTAIRATVAALVTGPAAPSPDRMSEAVSLLSPERRRAGRRAELSAALCDIANSLGDEVMLQQCVRELLSIAPHAPVTLRAKSRLDARCPPLRFWAGWLAIAAAIVGTLAHALRERMARGHAGRRAAQAAAIAVILATVAAAPERSALALELPKANQMLSKFPISDDDPESTIPSEEARNKDPLDFGYWLQDLIYKGEEATKRKDYVAAVKYYRAMVKAVPDRAIGYTRLCTAYEFTHDLEKASAACGAGLLQDGVTTDDYAHYVHLMLRKGNLSGKDQDTLRDLITNLKADPKAHPLVELLECDIGEHFQDIAQLEDCVPLVQAKAPNAPSSIRYELALALARHRFGEARAIVDRAKKAGAPIQVLQHMEAAVDSASHRRTWGLALWSLSGAFLAVALGFGAFYIVSRRRLGPAAQAT